MYIYIYIYIQNPYIYILYIYIYGTFPFVLFTEVDADQSLKALRGGHRAIPSHRPDWEDVATPLAKQGAISRRAAASPFVDPVKIRMPPENVLKCCARWSVRFIKGVGAVQKLENH